MLKIKLKKKISKKYNEGFSLIELMVVVAIIGFLILGLVTFFSGGTRSWIAGQSQLKAQREARQVMDRIVKEIREGNSATCIDSPPSITVNFPESINANSVTFGKSGDILYRNTLSNSLIENVLTFNVSCIDNSKVKIELEIDVDKDEKPDITLSSDVNLRNYGLPGI